MQRKFILAGALIMMIAVILGAMAAHTLKEILTVDQLNSFETAVRYQVYHGLALLIVSQINLFKARTKSIIFYGFIVGVLLFSGSIYLLVLGPLLDLQLSFLGPITPVGGLCLIITWLFIVVKTLKHKTQNN
ncbi:MAG: DUF423 domain-containing protein [Nonlabens sp.]